MKLSPASLGFLFLATTFTLAAVCPLEAAKETQDEAQAGCCLKYKNKEIQCKAIKSCEWAPSRCAKAAVIVRLKKNNRRLCLDPSKVWVQNLECCPPWS